VSVEVQPLAAQQCGTGGGGVGDLVFAVVVVISAARVVVVEVGGESGRVLSRGGASIDHRRGQGHRFGDYAERVSLTQPHQQDADPHFRTRLWYQIATNPWRIWGLPVSRAAAGSGGAVPEHVGEKGEILLGILFLLASARPPTRQVIHRVCIMGQARYKPSGTQADLWVE
jgi:hypothetical protein